MYGNLNYFLAGVCAHTHTFYAYLWIMLRDFQP